MESMEIVVVASIAFTVTVILSLLIGSLLYKRRLKRNRTEAEEKAKMIIKEAELQAENIKRSYHRSQGEIDEDEAGI